MDPNKCIEIFMSKTIANLVEFSSNFEEIITYIEIQ